VDNVKDAFGKDSGSVVMLAFFM